ncbi:DUF3427 domain-containing protein [Sporosarcina luteola]|uniref:HNH endonuclease n=1 Tax=Sporosarcina luteola TaxID=582850 RepID=UPI00203FD61C|nr:DUF3427 domain-containing protein [Sporosarcina luteola]MCM3742932.1 DUF3427 domain-containing protein [Sporosarcina luteola]
MKFPFVIGEEYSRKNVKAIIGHPEPDSIGGIWATGYASYEGCYFIFANIESAGRTGHDYPNILTDNELYWFSKGRDTLSTNTIQHMMNGEHEVYIFTRGDSSNVNFVFRGLGYVKDFEDGKPAHIVWGFVDNIASISNQYKAANRRRFIEGTKKDSTITIYERNPAARKACLDYYGYGCLVCSMNFEERYGEIGREFIHVHHEVEISTIGEEYEIDPINELKPVCPNCHAMLHKRKPAYSIDELKEISGYH